MFQPVPSCAEHQLSDFQWDSLVCNLAEPCSEEPGEEEGNSNSPPPNKMINPAKYWCFTLNNYTAQEYDEICARCSEISNVEWAIIAKEVGDSGTPHLQGAIGYTKKSRPMGLKCSRRIHWEKAKSNKEDQVRYCTKTDKNPFVKKIVVPCKLLAEEDFYDWQKALIKILREDVDDRDIHWVVGDYATGKTEFCKFLTKSEGWVGPLEGSARHIKSVCAEHQDAQGYIVHLPYGANIASSFYHALESIKDGYYMSHFGTKGTYPVCTNRARLIVFSNELPKKNAGWHETKYKFWKIDTNSKIQIVDYKKVEKIVDECLL